MTWRHKTYPGIKVDEVFGMDSKNGRVWIELARQIYCEQGETDYRVIDHFNNGAPYLEGYPGRISVSHTTHLFVVATLPKTPEVNLDSFNPRAAMGIDTEPSHRSQVLKIRNKFLNEDEQTLIPGNDLKANILAWTAKEALYKAAFMEGLDFRNAINIKKLPVVSSDPVRGSEEILGQGIIIFPPESGIETQQMKLFSYESYGCYVTIAYSPKCAKFGK